MKQIDLLIKNAVILTMDEDNPRAGSIAVSDGKISSIWETAEPPVNLTGITNQTEIVDLEGGVLVPGFIDTHNHILGYGILANRINCSTPPNQSITDLIKLIDKKADETPNGEWIQGYGYDDTLLNEGRHPTREDLDLAAPHHPVYLSHISGHLAVVNSLAFELAGLSNETPDPQGGKYGRYKDGKLNGVLYEQAAMAPINKIQPAITQEKMILAIEEAANDYIAKGITTNTDAAIYSPQDLSAHLEAARTRGNPMRTQLMILHHLLQEGAPFGDYTHEQLNEEIIGKSDGLAKLDSAKLFQDGSIQGLTGALRNPYFEHPHLFGDLIHEQNDFKEIILNLHQRGFRLAIHGNGDRAIGSILDAYDYALQKNLRDDHRHRIEHVQTATTDDIKRMKKLGVAGSFFINHVYYWGDRHKQIFLGPDRAERISPLAEALKEDILFTLHSDCPVTPISPLFSIWAAVNRLTRNGEVLGEEQRIDVLEALKSMTIYGAQLIFEEDSLGSIEIGKLADFAVLDADPLAIDPKSIKDITVLATFIGGKRVFELDQSKKAASHY